MQTNENLHGKDEGPFKTDKDGNMVLGVEPKQVVSAMITNGIKQDIYDRMLESLQQILRFDPDAKGAAAVVAKDCLKFVVEQEARVKSITKLVNDVKLPDDKKKPEESKDDKDFKRNMSRFE